MIDPLRLLDIIGGIGDASLLAHPRQGKGVSKQALLGKPAVVRADGAGEEIVFRRPRPHVEIAQQNGRAGHRWHLLLLDRDPIGAIFRSRNARTRDRRALQRCICDDLYDLPGLQQTLAFREVVEMCDIEPEWPHGVADDSFKKHAAIIEVTMDRIGRKRKDARRQNRPA